MDNINLGLILAQVVNFWILFFLFKRFIADRLNKTISKKRALLKKIDNAELEYKKTIESAYKQKDSIMKEARSWANKLFLDMEVLMRTKREELLESAEIKADLIVEWGRRQIERDRRTMLTQMKSKIVDLSLKLNWKLFKKSSVDKDYMEKELDHMVK